MTEWTKNFLETLKADKTSYREMVDFCADSLILNNDIMGALECKGFEFETINGDYFDEETGDFVEVFQWYIIDSQAAERFSDYTLELVVYNEALDLYLLGVTHWGTSWDGVSANWR